MVGESLALMMLAQERRARREPDVARSLGGRQSNIQSEMDQHAEGATQDIPGRSEVFQRIPRRSQKVKNANEPKLLWICLDFRRIRFSGSVTSRGANNRSAEADPTGLVRIGSRWRVHQHSLLQQRTALAILPKAQRRTFRSESARFGAVEAEKCGTNPVNDLDDNVPRGTSMPSMCHVAH